MSTPMGMSDPITALDAEREYGGVHVGHASTRWAAMVMKILSLDKDTRTLDECGHALGMSRASIKCRCASVGTSAKDTLDFARLLRVILQCQTQRWNLSEMLDIVDPRTLSRLLQRAGIDATSDRAPDAREFLRRQSLVTSRVLLAALTIHLCGVDGAGRPAD